MQQFYTIQTIDVQSVTFKMAFRTKFLLSGDFTINKTTLQFYNNKTKYEINELFGTI